MNKKLIVIVTLAILLLTSAAASVWRVGKVLRYLPYIELVNTAEGCSLNHNPTLIDERWIIEDDNGALLFNSQSETDAVEFLVNGCVTGGPKLER